MTPTRHAKEAIDLAHPAGVAGSEIVVDGDNVDALALECVEIHRKRRHQRLAFTGLHLGNLAAMECDRADHLDVVMTLAERPDRCLAHCRECFGKQIVELLAVRQPLAEALGLRAQFLIGQRGDIGLEAVDCLDIFAEAADVAIVGRSEDAFCHCGEHVNSLRNPGVRIGRNLSPTLGKLRPAM